jgi:hypothetical protein
MKPPRLLLVLVLVFALAAPAQDRPDLDTIYRIKQEAIQNSKVMDHVFWLTEVHGPRLTGSPKYQQAAEWVVKTLKEWGIADARLEKWGPFGRTWYNQRFSAHLLEPSYQPIYGFPLAWSPSTEGVLTGEPVHAPIRTEQDIERWKGKLKGRIVLTQPPRQIAPIDRPFMSRYTDEQLAGLALAPDPAPRPPQFGPAGPGPQMMGPPPADFQQVMAFRKKLAAFWREEGAAVLVDYGYRNDGGTISAAAGGTRDPKDPVPPPMIVITPEHYNRIVRLLENKIPVRVEIEVRNVMDNENADSHNVIAGLPGAGRNKDEVVMVGGHLDSWHGGTGATDNAAGSAVMMEVMRILKKLDLKLDRTVRLGLWGGEEQGLLGSRAYVREKFADPATMRTTRDWENFSAYYNIDNGTGKIRGIYLQGNEAARPFFEAQLAPFRDLGVTTVTIRSTSGTDHLAFDAVGLPGFQFIQDPIEYSTRTHHSNMDVYDRVQRGDLMQMAAVVTSLVYHTANRPEKLPRKPKPEPRPQGGPRGGAPSGGG